jgi:hypothetical protein
MNPVAAIECDSNPTKCFYDIAERLHIWEPSGYLVSIDRIDARNVFVFSPGRKPSPLLNVLLQQLGYFKK